nr:toll/interleukin-1 receptor domain-containing protein [uncultured Alistipes sp.]
MALEIKDIEPECFIRLNQELLSLKTPNCVNPFSFGAIVAIVSLLSMKYIDHFNKKKFFISHSSDDKPLVNSFIKEILKIGCGFKDENIFCTLDPSAIRTGDDFRDQIVENMKKCDYILLFISENYSSSDICKNKIGVARALERKRVLPFILPRTLFILNVVKQGASITEKRKLDELYQELCNNYDMKPNWPSFNKAKEDFINSITTL